MKMGSLQPLVLALMINLAIASVDTRARSLNPFDDVHFWHAVERLLIHIKPEVITEDGIEMPPETSSNMSSRINNPHGYMHVVFNEAMDQTQSKNGNSAGRIIVGIEPIKETNNRKSATTTLTFDINSTKVNIDDILNIELAFSCPNDVHIGLMDVWIDNEKPLKVPVKVRGPEKYHTIEVPWRKRGGHQRPNDPVTVHLRGLSMQIEHPLLVVYARLNQSRVQTEHPVRRVRSAHLPPRTCKRCAYAERKRPLSSPAYASSPASTGGKGHRNSHHDTCGLRQWYVTLGDLRWDTWVIAPAGFRMDYCSGPCQAPIVDTLYNATNHAVVRSMLLAGHLSENMPDIPPPYCVPIKLRSTNIMYQESGQFVIKNLDNIIAEQCGCS